MTTRFKTSARRRPRSRRSASSFDFTSSELRTLRALKTPAGIQRFLDELPYNLSYTARSPKKVLRDRTASCLEGGIFAAAALRIIGFPPLIFDLEAEQDTDHVIAIFKVRGHWGAVAKSNFTGCRYREPVYRSLRELAMSYFNIYFNLRGERTLRRYSRPVNLARFDRLTANIDNRKTSHSRRSTHIPRRNGRSQKVTRSAYRGGNEITVALVGAIRAGAHGVPGRKDCEGATRHWLVSHPTLRMFRRRCDRRPPSYPACARTRQVVDPRRCLRA